MAVSVSGAMLRRVSSSICSPSSRWRLGCDHSAAMTNGTGKGHSKWEPTLLEGNSWKNSCVIRLTELAVESLWYWIYLYLNKSPFFIHTEELVERYPELTPKEARENAITKEYGAKSFWLGLVVLSDGKPHDGRAPDYDDWTTETEKWLQGLNDILFGMMLGAAFELSSMGTADITSCQVAITEIMFRIGMAPRALEWTLSTNYRGGIGQSRMAGVLAS